MGKLFGMTAAILFIDNMHNPQHN